MKIALWIVVFASIIGLALDDIRMRLKLHKYWREQADEAARRLTGLVQVNGNVLPVPDNDHWKFEIINLSTNNGSVREEKALSLGSVSVSIKFQIFIGNSLAMTADKETKKYAEDVWRCYRNRESRKAVENV